MATSVITITSGESTAQAQDRLYKSGAMRVTANKVISYFKGLESGSQPGGPYTVDIQVAGGDAVAASGTATITHANLTAGDTITIARVVVTARASGATGNEFNIGADATADATALTTLINTSSSFTGICTATSALGVVTITSAVKGTIGNGLLLATSDATAFALVQPSGGAAATANSYSFG
jgi:hypothetical protein